MRSLCSLPPTPSPPCHDTTADASTFPRPQVFSTSGSAPPVPSSRSAVVDSLQNVAAAAWMHLSPPRTLDGWRRQVDSALRGKARAAAEARAYRCRRMLQQRSLVAAAAAGAAERGEPPPPPPRPGAWAETLEQRQQVVRWRRQRQFALLLAEDAASGALLGTAALTLATPEAALPPPFPSSKPRRAYLSNMAVVPAARRRGVASALVAACERVAAAWRKPSLWLHCDRRNTAAAALYAALGFEEVRREPALPPLQQRSLLRKRLPPRPPPLLTAAAAECGVGGARNGSGVFVWRVSEGPSSSPPSS